MKNSKKFIVIPGDLSSELLNSLENKIGISVTRECQNCMGTGYRFKSEGFDNGHTYTVVFDWRKKCCVCFGSGKFSDLVYLNRSAVVQVYIDICDMVGVKMDAVVDYIFSGKDISDKEDT